MFAATLFAVLLGAGPAVASAAACCPPAELASPALAAAGCCGQCPTTLAPTPEPASLVVKSSSPDPGPAVSSAAPDLSARPLDEAAAAPVARTEVAFPPRLSPVPLRI